MQRVRERGEGEIVLGMENASLYTQLGRDEAEWTAQPESAYIAKLGNLIS